MRYTREDVYKKMRDEGRYSDANDYRSICERNGHSMHENIDRFSVQDGAAFSHVGDEAERAFEHLRAEERRQEERRQEEDEQERECEARERQRRYEAKLEGEQEDNLSEE